MSLLDDVPGSAKVGLDSAPLIYWIEKHPLYYPILLPFFECRFEQGLSEAITSVVSFAEVLVKPLAMARADLVERYKDFFARTKYFHISTITSRIGERAAELRARLGIRLPDAFQIAASLEMGATHFITNDHALRKVTELRILVLNDYLPSQPE